MQNYDALYDKVNLLEDALGSGDTIEEAIKKVGGRLDVATNIDQQGQTLDALPIDGEANELLQDSAILDLIWDSELNEVSVIQEGSDDVFVVNVTAETEQARQLRKLSYPIINASRQYERHGQQEAQLQTHKSTPRQARHFGAMALASTMKPPD